MMLKFNVNNQIIARTDAFRVVADSRNYLTARFTFTEEWKGDIIAIFGNGEEYYNVVLSENTCIVPWEVIKPPFFTISVFCSDGSLVTANIVTVDVEKSGLEEGKTPTIPTPDVWQQYIASMQEAIDKGIPYIGDSGNWFLYDAETGIYKDTGVSAIGPKGDRGEMGEKGDKGDTPQKGIDYYTEEDKNEIIDQAYSPTSEKAQSGKAVAEAVNKPWQLIENITLTEPVTQVVIPKDKLNFKEIHIESLVIPTDTTVTSQTFILNVGFSNLWYASGNPKSTGRIYVMFDLFINPDNKIACEGNLSSFIHVGGSSFTSFGYYFLNDAAVHNYISDAVGGGLYFTTNTAEGMTTGTRIKVWGR